MADVELAITGVPGTASVGAVVPSRTIALSGWFDPPGSGDGYNWLLVDRASRLIDWTYCGIPAKARWNAYVISGNKGDLF